MSGHLLIDLDGVIRVWDASAVEKIEQQYTLPSGSIVTAAFGSGSLLHDAVTGHVTDEQWRRDTAGRLHLVCGSVATEVVESWSAPAGSVDQLVVSVLDSARHAGWRIGLLTNATTRLSRDLRALGLHDSFDVVVNSSDLGVAKPDPHAYLEACHLLGVEPVDCMFIDDTAANVAAATAIGMDAHLHRGASYLAGLLGVPLPASVR